MIVKEITGQDLKDAIENGVQSYPETRGAFPHVAGFTFKFDPMKEVGDKVYDLTFNNGEKLDLNRTYKIATNDFMAVGGDKYTSLKGKKTVNEYEGLEEIFGEYIKSNGITHTVVDGRVFAGKEVMDSVENKNMLSGYVYTIQLGDTLSLISEKTGIDTDTLLKENRNIINPDMIFEGDEILLPKLK